MARERDVREECVVAAGVSEWTRVLSSLTPSSNDTCAVFVSTDEDHEYAVSMPLTVDQHVFLLLHSPSSTVCTFFVVRGFNQVRPVNGHYDVFRTRQSRTISGYVTRPPRHVTMTKCDVVEYLT